MKRIRIVGLCLAAIFALTALMATGASAESPPEVGRCLKLAGGKWKDGGCKTPSKPGEEKFEWYPAFIGGVPNENPKPIKLKYSAKWKEGTLIQLETVSGEKIIAHGQSSLGEVTGAKTNVATNIVFTGVEAFEVPCKSTKPAATNAGEVKVNNLNGLIGIEKFNAEGNHAKDKAGNLFVPVSGSTFTEFECAGVPIVVRHEVMNPLTSNAMKLTATVKFAATKGKQKPEKFATDPSGTKRTLESNKAGGAFEQAGQTLTTIQTNEEKLEINTSE
jgi:hypothetical protein